MKNSCFFGMIYLKTAPFDLILPIQTTIKKKERKKKQRKEMLVSQTGTHTTKRQSRRREVDYLKWSDQRERRRDPPPTRRSSTATATAAPARVGAGWRGEEERGHGQSLCPSNTSCPNHLGRLSPHFIFLIKNYFFSQLCISYIFVIFFSYI